MLVGMELGDIVSTSEAMSGKFIEPLGRNPVVTLGFCFYFHFHPTTILETYSASTRKDGMKFISQRLVFTSCCGTTAVFLK